MIDSPLLTIPEVAAALRCSESHVRRLIQEGKLATCDISTAGSTLSKTRVKRVALNQYIQHL
jgi:excisionase family DNA binding protein